VNRILLLTEHKQMDAHLKASLQEKEVLLRETHHRVKNNLQVISSLLTLQANAIRDGEIRKLFQESQQRIRSMGLIHEQLYQSGNLAAIDLGDYIRRLVAYVLQAYQNGAERLQLELTEGEVLVHADIAIPCGLILNELLTNALRHAFPAGEPGDIHIALHAVEGQHMTLSVRDTGVGFPEGLDFRETGTLGLQLVCLLTEQLRGTIELTHRGGTQFTLTVPL